MPWGQGPQTVQIDNTIGTLSALKVEVAAPIRADTGTLNLRSGGGLGLTNGTLQARTGGGIGLTNGTIQARLVGAIRLANGTIGIRVEPPMAVRAGSVILEVEPPLRSDSRGTLVMRRGGGLVLSGGTLIPRLGGGIGLTGAGAGLTGGTISARTGGGLGLTSGTIQVRLASPLRLSSGSAGLGTVTQRSVGSFSITPAAINIMNWNMRPHLFYEGWLDQRRANRNTQVAGAEFKYEYGGIGIGSLGWTMTGGSATFPGPGTAYMVAAAGATRMNARGTYFRFLMMEYAHSASPTGLYFNVLGSARSDNYGTYFTIRSSPGASGTLNLEVRTAEVASTLITGTANQAAGVRRRLGLMRQGAGSWVLLADRGLSDAGWRVVGRTSNTTAPTAYNLRMAFLAASGSFVVHRIVLSDQGR